MSVGWREKLKMDTVPRLLLIDEIAYVSSVALAAAFVFRHSNAQHYRSKLALLQKTI